MELDLIGGKPPLSPSVPPIVSGFLWRFRIAVRFQTDTQALNQAELGHSREALTKKPQKTTKYGPFQCSQSVAIHDLIFYNCGDCNWILVLPQSKFGSGWLDASRLHDHYRGWLLTWGQRIWCNPIQQTRPVSKSQLASVSITKLHIFCSEEIHKKTQKSSPLQFVCPRCPLSYSNPPFFWTTVTSAYLSTIVNSWMYAKAKLHKWFQQFNNLVISNKQITIQQSIHNLRTLPEIQVQSEAQTGREYRTRRDIGTCSVIQWRVHISATNTSTCDLQNKLVQPNQTKPN